MTKDLCGGCRGCVAGCAGRGHEAHADDATMIPIVHHGDTTGSGKTPSPRAKTRVQVLVDRFSAVMEPTGWRRGDSGCWT